MRSGLTPSLNLSHATCLRGIAPPPHQSVFQTNPLGSDARAVLGAEIREVRLRVDPVPGRTLERLLRRELPAVRMHVLAEPAAQRAELPALDLVFEIWNVLERFLPDLHRHDSPQQVGREVPNQSGGPVRVLEDTVRVVRDVHTEVVAHALVPDLRKVSELDAPVDDVLLELEAQ